MRSLIAFLVLMIVIVGAALGIRSCSTEAEHRQVELSEGADDSAIITLPGSATIIAPPGSFGAEMAAYLASKEAAPRRFRLGEGEFPPLSGAPSPATEAGLVTLAALLKAYPDATAGVVGHTDNVGTEAANVALSLERARAVVAELVARGIETERLAASGMGSTRPIASNDSDAGRAANRRIEIVLTRIIEEK